MARILLTSIILTLTISSPALAYIGPGAGISFIGAFIGLVVAVLSAVGIILYYPIKKMIKNKKSKAESQKPANGNDKSESTNASNQN